MVAPEARALAQMGMYTDNCGMPDGYVTVRRAAEILNCKEQQVRDMIRADLIKSGDREKIGLTWLIREEALKGLTPGKKGRPRKITRE